MSRDSILRYPFTCRCFVTIPLEWRTRPLVHVCATPDLPPSFDWHAQLWLTPAHVAWDSVRCVVTVHFLMPESGTVVLLAQPSSPAYEAQGGPE